MLRPTDAERRQPVVMWCTAPPSRASIRWLQYQWSADSLIINLPGSSTCSVSDLS
ncbi:hypothetical protein PFWH6_1739 [Pseudomonas fluorescens WH6]|nr:hypothetical protein PFWH6_1739 [Pseudomonas fluorescens WH6]